MATTECILEIFGVFGDVPYATKPDFNLARCAQIWLAVFGDVGDTDLMHAALGFVRATPGGFWPTPGAVRQHLPEPVDAEPEWPEAYARLADVARTRGSGRYDRKRSGIGGESDFEGFFPRSEAAEKATRAGINAIGGWQTYCMSKTGDQTVRAAFRDAYKAALATEVRRGNDSAVRALLGRAGVQELEGPGFLQLIVGGRS